MKNPKQIAIEAIEQTVETAAPATLHAEQTAPVAATDTAMLLDPTLATNMQAQQMEVDALERALQNHPEASMEASQYITQARQALSSGQPVPANALAHIQRTLGDIEMKQALGMVGGGALALAGGAAAMGAMSDLSHLEGILGRDGAIAGGILLKGHNEATELSSAIFNDKDNKTIQISSAGNDRLFDRGFVDPGSRVAAMQPVKGIDTGVGISRP